MKRGGGGVRGALGACGSVGGRALRAAVCEQSGRRRPRAVPVSCGGSAGGPSDDAVALASAPGRCGSRQRARASAGPRRAARGPNLAASSRGLLLAATRRVRAPSSEEVFFVAKASRGRCWLGAGVVTMGAERPYSSDAVAKLELVSLHAASEMIFR